MVHDDCDLQERVRRVAARLQTRGGLLAVAESCTGGLLAKVITDLSGASAWFDHGVVVYSNGAKEALLGVPAEQLAAHGAVSQPVAEALARGLLDRAAVTHAVATTGVAGPLGGTPEKPVGTVWIAWAVAQSWPASVVERSGPGASVQAEAAAPGSVVCVSRCYHFAGSRDAVRRATVAAALDGLGGMLE